MKLYISTTPVLLCLSSFPASNKINFISITQLLAELAHLRMSFILQLACAARSPSQLQNNAHMQMR